MSFEWLTILVLIRQELDRWGWFVVESEVVIVSGVIIGSEVIESEVMTESEMIQSEVIIECEVKID